MNSLLLLTIGAAGQVAMANEPARQTLAYAPAPADNPLKGLVPYATLPDFRRDSFPHSMEFNYIPLSALVTGYDQYDWTPLEKLLAGAANRGHQAIFRVYQEWPGQKDLIPAFLIQDGLKVHKYLNTNTQPFPPAEVETPDYADANLRKVMRLFIAALGKKYDGDPRIGFITAGLLGTWGEWHDWPRTELFAGKEVQAEVMAAYETAFHVTPVLLRCPAGEKHGAIAANAQRPFGYHDDSFAWSTLDTGRKEDAHFFLAVMKAAGPAAFDKWKTRPIGGEIRPEAWGKVFDPDPGAPEIQNFRKCVEATHVSWLMDSGLFQQERDAGRIQRAEKDVRRMGYEFHVPTVTIRPPANGILAVKVEVENRGVAPFYYDWPVEFGLLDADGHVVKTFPGSGKITGLLPGDSPRSWDEKLDLQGVKPGAYILALRIPNPLPKGMPIRFANQTQDRHAPGWLTLGSLVITQEALKTIATARLSRPESLSYTADPGHGQKVIYGA